MDQCSTCVSKSCFSLLQIFFKNIGVNIKSVKPTSLLKNRKREIDGNPDFRNKDFGVAQGSQPQMIDEFKSENISPQNHVELPTNAGVHSKLLPQVNSDITVGCPFHCYEFSLLMKI